MRNLHESRESDKLPLKFVGFDKFGGPPSELNSTAISENLPLRRSSKMTLGKGGIYGTIASGGMITHPSIQTNSETVVGSPLTKLQVTFFNWIFGLVGWMVGVK